ncbi:MAG: hypothetical protein PHR39_02955 [Actinomycetota bacterium]|nr:hypothetical protein [Actinomycetota bacterium]
MENDNVMFETKDFYLTAYLKAREYKFSKIRCKKDKQEIISVS